MYSYLTLTDIEEDMVTVFKQIDRDIGTAGDDGFITKLDDLSRIAWLLGRIASETDEWSCFAIFVEYRKSLDAICQNLFDRLMSN